jgi:cytochrome c biogenesis protein CcmG/thiol:disulfide interchange protein DsbE
MPRSVSALGRRLVGVLAFASLVGCGASRPTPVASVGRTAPVVAVPLIDGSVQDLASDGEVVVIAFFTTWCPASGEMLRALEEVREGNKGAGLSIVALDEGDSAERVKQFVRSKQLKVAVGFDKDGQLAKEMSLPTVPALVVIDRRGVVRHLHAGYHGAADRTAILAEVSALLGEAPASDDGAAPQVGAPEVVAAE